VRAALVAIALLLGAAPAAQAITIGPPAVDEGVAAVTVDRSEGPTWPSRKYTVEVVPDASSETRVTPGEDAQEDPREVSFAVGQRTATVELGFGGGRIVEPTEHGRLVLRDQTGDIVAESPLAVRDDDAEFAETEVTVRESAGRVTLRLVRPWAIETPVDFTVGAFTLDNRPAADVAVPPVRMEPGASVVAFDATFAYDQQQGPDRRFKLVLGPGDDPAAAERSQPRAAVTVTVLDEDVLAPSATVAAPHSVRVGRRLVATVTADEAGDVVASLELGRRLARRLRVARRIAVADGSLLAGQPKRLVLRTRRATARRLRRGRRRLTATLRIRLDDDAGNRRTLTQRIRLTR
jgi:hypothetical protein